MKIYFDNTQCLGDTALAIKGLYAAKCLYPKNSLVMLTNGYGKSLYRACSFIDKILVENEDYTKDEKFKGIDESDILILINSDGYHISLAKQSKCQNIIAFVRQRNFFSPRFRVHWLFHKSLQEESRQILSLVRLIDKKRFDDGIKKIDFTACTFETTRDNQSKIDDFLSKIPHPYTKIININIFCNTAVNYNFSVQDWRQMIAEIASEFKDFLFILTNFQRNSVQLDEFGEKNVAIFVNDSDLLNLVELTKRFSLCISVSTGNIHIARMMSVSCLALYPSKDRIRYAGNGGGGEL